MENRSPLHRRRELGASSARALIEQNFARCDKGVEIDHLGKDVGKLLLSWNKHDLDPLVDDQPAKVVLPTKEMGGTRSDAKFVAEIVGGRVVNEHHVRALEVNFERVDKLDAEHGPLAQQATCCDLGLSR